MPDAPDPAVVDIEQFTRFLRRQLDIESVERARVLAAGIASFIDGRIARAFDTPTDNKKKDK